MNILNLIKLLRYTACILVLIIFGVRFVSADEYDIVLDLKKRISIILTDEKYVSDEKSQIAVLNKYKGKDICYLANSIYNCNLAKDEFVKLVIYREGFSVTLEERAMGGVISYNTVFEIENGQILDVYNTAAFKGLKYCE